jgi:glutamine amidotransferase
MQILSSRGVEGGDTRGLGFIDGEVLRLKPVDDETRIPHVGWNDVLLHRQSALFDSIPDGSNFYFVHSYFFCPKNEENVLAITPYCGNFTSAVVKGNILGVQFHPEKSQRLGFQLLKNFLKI